MGVLDSLRRSGLEKTRFMFFVLFFSEWYLLHVSVLTLEGTFLLGRQQNFDTRGHKGLKIIIIFT